MTAAALPRSISVKELSAGANVMPLFSQATTRVAGLKRSAAEVDPVCCLSVSDALPCASTSIIRTRRPASAINQVRCTASVVLPTPPFLIVDDDRVHRVNLDETICA